MSRTPCPRCRQGLVDDGFILMGCSVCGSDGFLDEIGPPVCAHCGGDGWQAVYDASGGPPAQESCEVCDGSGLGSQWLPEHIRNEYDYAEGLGVVTRPPDQPRPRHRDLPDIPDWWEAMIGVYRREQRAAREAEDPSP